MQTLLFEDDADISQTKREILAYCCCRPGHTYIQDGSRDWQRTEAYLDRVSKAFGVTKWSELRTMKQAEMLKRAFHWEHHGGTSVDFPENVKGRCE